MIDLPNSELIQYLNRFSAAAIYILTAPGRTTLYIGTATDIRKSIHYPVRYYGPTFRDGADVSWAAWCDKAAAGRIVKAVARTDYRGGLIEADVAGAVAAIETTARRYGVTLTSHERTLDRARAALGAIAEKVDAERESGGLAFFNKEFKRRRQEAIKRGARFPSYGGALAKLKRLMAEQPACGLASATILSRVFGE